MAAFCLMVAACDQAGAPKVQSPSIVTPSVLPTSTAPTPSSTVYVLTQISGGDVLRVVALDSGAVRWSVSFQGEPVPLSLEVANGLGRAYVLTGHNSGATLTPVSLATGIVGSPIAVGKLATSLVVSPGGSMAYVVNAGGGILALPQADGSTVTPVNLRTNQALPPITVGDGPGGMAFATDTTAYVSRVLAREVVAVNLDDGHVGPSVAVPSSQSVEATPGAIAVSPHGTLLAVGNLQQDLGLPAPVVNVLDLHTWRWQAPIPLAGSTNAVSAMAFSNDGRHLYVLARGAVNVMDALYIVDVATRSVIQSPYVVDGLAGAAFALAPNETTVYLAAGQANGNTAIVPIDAVSGVAHTPVAVLPGAPVAIALGG